MDLLKGLLKKAGQEVLDAGGQGHKMFISRISRRAMTMAVDGIDLGSSCGDVSQFATPEVISAWLSHKWNKNALAGASAGGRYDLLDSEIVDWLVMHCDDMKEKGGGAIDYARLAADLADFIGKLKKGGQAKAESGGGSGTRAPPGGGASMAPPAKKGPGGGPGGGGGAPGLSLLADAAAALGGSGTWGGGKRKKSKKRKYSKRRSSKRRRRKSSRRRRKSYRRRR